MKKRAQSTIEFTIGFIITILFLILTCNLFVWFNNCLVSRQRAYENTRVEAADGRVPSWWEFWREQPNPGKDDFYTPPTLSIFSKGGRQ